MDNINKKIMQWCRESKTIYELCLLSDRNQRIFFSDLLSVSSVEVIRQMTRGRVLRYRANG